MTMTDTNPAAAVVVGVDGSPQSLHAVDWAAQEALARQCPLQIVHAFLWPLMKVPLGPSEFGPPDGGLQHAAEKIVSTAVDRARLAAPGLEIRTDMPVRAPAAALIDASQDAAVVVIGNRGLGGFTGLLLGSVGVQTAAHAACPVIIVRDGDGDGLASGRVVVGVDGSELSRLAVDFGFAHAARHGLGIVAVNVDQWPAFADRVLAAYDSVDHRRADQVRLLDDALAGYGDRYPDVPVDRKVLHGQPAAVIVAVSSGAALTVVGSRGRGGFTGLLLGSTSQNVLQHATGPVAVVRPQLTGVGAGQATIQPRPEPPQADPAPAAASQRTPTASPPPGGQAADAGASAAPSLAKSLFTGRLPAAMVLPYPQLAHDEQGKVDALIADARGFLDAHYDPAHVEQQGWATTPYAAWGSVACSGSMWHPSTVGWVCRRPAIAG